MLKVEQKPKILFRHEITKLATIFWSIVQPRLLLYAVNSMRYSWRAHFLFVKCHKIKEWNFGFLCCHQACLSITSKISQKHILLIAYITISSNSKALKFYKYDQNTYIIRLSSFAWVTEISSLGLKQSELQLLN